MTNRLLACAALLPTVAGSPFAGDQTVPGSDNASLARLRQDGMNSRQIDPQDRSPSTCTNASVHREVFTARATFPARVRQRFGWPRTAIRETCSSVG
jgi:hypothetical protein